MIVPSLSALECRDRCVLARSSAARVRHRAGFTLIELMIVLVILAVILAIGLPGFSNVFLGTRLSNYANELVSSVYIARGEAIKRNLAVTLCASADGTTCSGANAWGEGWMVLDSDDNVIKSNPAVAAGFVVQETGANVNSMIFDGSGLVSTAATFKICRQDPSVGIQDREVSVTNIGRTSVTTQNTGSCP